MSTKYLNSAGGIVFDDPADLELVQEFCKKNDIEYDYIDPDQLHASETCPHCGDSEFYSASDGHCGHCGK
jgi:hypothetical protein